MELKVWVEGIQRIVCGVNEKTTCQDVVFALAHATGKTGRFTLIERWRNSERLLAPSEVPLKVLLKWGEHSNDVQFILQWSPLDPSTSSTSTASKSGQVQQQQSVKGNVADASGGCGGNVGIGENSSSHYQQSPSSSASLLKSSQSATNPTTGSPQAHPSPLLSGAGGGNERNACLLLSSSSSSSPQNDGSGSRKTLSTTQLSSSSAFHATSEPPRPWNLFSQNRPGGSSVATVPPPPSSSSSSDAAIQSRELRSPTTAFTAGSMSMKRPTTMNADIGNLGRGHVVHIPPRGQMISGPPPYREPPTPPSSSHSHPNQTPPLTSPTAYTSKNLPPYREPPAPGAASATYPINRTSNGISHSPVTSPGMTPPGCQQQFNHGTSVRGNVNGFSNGSLVNASLASSLSSKDIKHPLTTTVTATASLSSSNARQDSPVLTNSANEMDSWKAKDNAVGNGDLIPNKNLHASKSSPLSTYNNNSSSNFNSNSHYRELIRVVNTQREKLSSQQAELTQYDAEIMFWEGKAKEQQKHMDLINKEISRLEVVSAQHESQTLSLVHLEDEHEYSQRESTVLKSEMHNLRTELEKCDGEIEQCKQRIRALMEELHLTQHQMAQRQQEWLDKEASTLAEIERLRRELDVMKRETESTSDMSGSLDRDVQNVEMSLNDKRKQMERLVTAMKEANLQSLSIQPPEDLMEVHQRAGSTRRMIGSPRQLENAAPTSKNPHGVWV